MMKILLVDDHKVIRDGIKFYLRDHPDCQVQFEAEDGLEALGVLKDHEVDLVITDISMPGMDGIELLKEVRKTKPHLPFIALSMMDDYRHVKQMLDADVNGYLLKTCTEKELYEAIHCVLNDEPYFSAEINKVLVENLDKIAQGDKEVVPLSDREREVLHLILEQCTNKEIADKLFISVRTVDSHKRNMIDKTGSKNIAGLIRYAFEYGIV